LLNGDDNVGVWIVVIVDEKSALSNKSRLPSALAKREDETSRQKHSRTLYGVDKFNEIEHDGSDGA
jgi:hypothetical protein